MQIEDIVGQNYYCCFKWKNGQKTIENLNWTLKQATLDRN